jgi:IMP cyclohydrolase
MTKKKTAGDTMGVIALTPDKIHHEISRQLSRGVPYIDALVDFAEKNNLEIETIAQIVKKSSILREKIRNEAVKLRMVKVDEEKANLDDLYNDK